MFIRTGFLTSKTWPGSAESDRNEGESDAVLTYTTQSASSRRLSTNP